MKKIIITFKLLLLAVTFSFAQNTYNLYPANWWVGMKYNKLQIMINGTDVGKHSGFAIAYPGVTLTKVNKFESKNYVILDVTIAQTAKPGTVAIRSKSADGKAINFQFSLQ
ncbi:MAG TPA: cyclomaltodextrinase N-terminal domain-containing protein, partial [Lacibacter sp.]|nr:cyclomaltodextrinase N-terminal domain-containing protein [Lacibacter sp.]